MNILVTLIHIAMLQDNTYGGLVAGFRCADITNDDCMRATAILRTLHTPHTWPYINPWKLGHTQSACPAPYLSQVAYRLAPHNLPCVYPRASAVIENLSFIGRNTLIFRSPCSASTYKVLRCEPNVNHEELSGMSSFEGAHIRLSRRTGHC